MDNKNLWIRLYCAETGSLVHTVDDAVSVDEITAKAFERHYSEYYNKPLFAEIS